MYLFIVLCSVLFVTSDQSENSTLAPIHLKNITSSIGPDLHVNKTKLPLVSEGGTLLPNILDISLPKMNFTNYISLDDEILDKPKEKSSVPRKGVDNFLLQDSNVSSHVSNSYSSTENREKLNMFKNKSSLNLGEPASTKTAVVKNKTIELKKLDQTEVHKKPTILSYEALKNMENHRKSDQSKIPIVPSTKTIASNQIPSPNDDTIVKVYPSKANSHPGMIMPIVITILVVPMFAIVGYMALRKGQEAWKNRHYKRMDFLLDGMYND